MAEHLIPCYAPGLADPADLEAIFVQHETLAGRIVDLVKESARTDSKHQQLLVGGPGLGKTHLLSLVVDRLRALNEPLLALAWLGEEVSGIRSYLDLLLYLLEKAGARIPETLYETDPEDAEITAGDLLVEVLGGRTLCVAVENLERLFTGLGEDGRHKLRAFMQETSLITFLATSPRLFDGISKRTEPFYGTFSINHLAPLSEAQTGELLQKIAAFHGDQELAESLEKAAGRARVKAFHHLAQGNHRVCVLFARHLTRHGLIDLTAPLIAVLDDLIPLGRAWIEALPRQPRKIVHLLCAQGSAITVKEIARRCFLKHQTVSSQLKLLRDRGYVQATAVGRDSFYEVRDPLMRLCIAMQLDQGRAVRRLIDFLRDWYDPRAGENPAIDTMGALLVDQSTPEVRFQQAREMLASWQARNELPALAQGLVRNIPRIRHLLLSADSARLWLGVWKEAAGNLPELRLGLQLLDAAVRTLENPGPEIALGLSAEERPILERLMRPE